MRQTMNEVIKELSKKSLTGCGFKVGDRVTYANDYGEEWKDLRVIGFSLPSYEGGGSVYLNFGCYWFPIRPESLKLEKKVEPVKTYTITVREVSHVTYLVERDPATVNDILEIVNSDANEVERTTVEPIEVVSPKDNKTL